MLHLIFHWSAESPLIERIGQKDALLLMGNVLFSLLKTGHSSATLDKLTKTHPMYVLLSELETRGIAPEQLVSGITVIDYPTFVQLTTKYSTVCSWN